MNKEEICNSRSRWSENGAIVSGHTFIEIEQPDISKRVLKCEICGYESIGWKLAVNKPTCTCGEPHISTVVCHHNDGTPCHLIDKENKCEKGI